MNMSLHLTEQEVNELCAPLKQRAAQARFIEVVLGIKVTGKRPDGLPLVGRTAVAQKLNNEQTLTPSPKYGFKWSK
ncbi:MAG: hypothetical protein ITG01_03925 [Comamonas sp.]|jgi:hypothetical protein|nr:hypothetical protein [Comamonas sp.]